MAPLYKHQDFSDEALREVFKGFPATIFKALNDSLTLEITQTKSSSIITSMAKRKALSHDGSQLNYFNNYGQFLD